MRESALNQTISIRRHVDMTELDQKKDITASNFCRI